MVTTWPSRNRDRLVEIEALSRPLTTGEATELRRIKRALSNLKSQRKRYARDAAFRLAVQRRTLARYYGDRA